MTDPIEAEHVLGIAVRMILTGREAGAVPVGAARSFGAWGPATADHAHRKVTSQCTEGTAVLVRSAAVPMILANRCALAGERETPLAFRTVCIRLALQDLGRSLPTGGEGAGK
jgi:hypothetical protein